MIYRGISRKSLFGEPLPVSVLLEVNQISNNFSAPSKKWPVIVFVYLTK
jgi:hypothetical protein